MTYRKTKQSNSNQQNYLALTLSFVSIALFSAYVWQVNIVSIAGFGAKEIEREISVLRQEQSKLEREVAELQSVESVNRRIKMLGLVPAEQITYVLPDQTSVAIR